MRLPSASSPPCSAARAAPGPSPSRDSGAEPPDAVGLVSRADFGSGSEVSGKVGRPGRTVGTQQRTIEEHSANAVTFS
jgi:hypothetical protein